MDPAIFPFFRRGNLMAGLLLIVFVATGPAFAVLLNFQHDLWREREVQARGIALRRAELISAAMGSIIEGTRQMMLALSVTQRAGSLAPACAGLLDDLRQGAPAYAVLAIVRRNGAVVCSSATTPLADGAVASLAEPFLAADRFVTGRYTSLPSLAAPILSFGLPFAGRNGGDQAVLVAGLDLRRLDTLLAELHQPADGRLVIADRDGAVLARAPVQAAPLGSQIEQKQELLGAAAAGTELSDAPDRPQRVTGYVPPGANPAGLFITAGFGVADLVSGIDQAADRGYLLIALGAALSILLALLIGHRYLRAPASVLLEAAQRWGSGDLGARATMPASATSEFAGLGTAFNKMAELLQQQRFELRALNEALELRVAERTRALLDSNNRLQVEIAERELTEGSLRQAQKLQAVGQLAGGMAHDFNNLLTAILGSLELLRKRLPAADGRQEALLDTASEAVERGSRLTAQLLAFSRKQPLLAVSVDVGAAIAGMAGLLASTLGTAVRIETRVDPDLWPALLDPNQFEAALLNLALNARDAMPGGGRLLISADNAVITPVSPWTELAPGDYVNVMVSDTGTGMSAEAINRAFEPFFTTKPPGKGSGLGLSQVHGMVRQSGGSIAIESRSGGGTKVSLMLPRSLSDPLTEVDGPDQTVPALGRNEAVLLVDDDIHVRDVTEAVLVDAGYTVVTSPDGAAALAVLEAEHSRIGLVIADYAMPGITGRELLQTVRLRWPGIAVLLATGYADYPELTGQDLRIDQIVRKPFRSNELLARIHMVVQREGGEPALDGVSAE